ncbi:hypothetical protein DdX_18121 [Ditylenchus destructor]|uniref:DUF7083 domain-containing protein n=1 Tax=Ditylenchus destructor TaxID=166010 RepID=A0AAD4MK94_9BILA|nr:hypothetical protein DdX_18121 [Ditylenchus destructor]
MEDLVKQMLAQTQMLQEALAKQAQESREERERAETKAREDRERAETKAREDRERLEAQLREERERAEERFAALLAKQTGTVPAQNGEQLLISTLSNRIELFNYLPEEDLYFQVWYKRYGEIFEEDGKEVSDPAKARLLVQKLGTTAVPVGQSACFGVNQPKAYLEHRLDRMTPRQFHRISEGV